MIRQRQPSKIGPTPSERNAFLPNRTTTANRDGPGSLNETRGRSLDLRTHRPVVRNDPKPDAYQGGRTIQPWLILGKTSR